VSEIFWTVLWGLMVFGALIFMLLLGIACLARSYANEVAQVVARIKGGDR